MDVYCSNCAEPWDMHHMRNDAPFDIIPDGRELELDELDRWEATAKAFAKDGTLLPSRREMMKVAGWVFGESLFVIKRCPCCDENGQAGAEERERLSIIQELSGHDPDGMACDMEGLR